jgi:uncharacterized protein (DUF486 family)
MPSRLRWRNKRSRRLPDSVIYMNQPFKLDYVRQGDSDLLSAEADARSYIWAALCLVGAVYFIFRS